jgi:hypothetical protein
MKKTIDKTICISTRHERQCVAPTVSLSKKYTPPHEKPATEVRIKSDSKLRGRSFGHFELTNSNFQKLIAAHNSQHPIILANAEPQGARNDAKRFTSYRAWRTYGHGVDAQ